MRRFARLAATLLLLVLSFPLGASSPQDPLWGKAVELARAGKDWVPQTASFLLELVDDGGVPRESWQSWYRISVSPSGDMILEVTRAVHNGADTTEKERESQKKRKATPFSMGDNPFDPLLQETVDAAPRGETATVAGRRCARYDFSMKKKDGAVLTGTSWLDERTGAPVEVSYTGSRLPRGVLELATTLRYAPGPGGEAFLKEARVEGVAGILFLRRSFRTSITIEGYARRG
jgi:hypothetical protein